MNENPGLNLNSDDIAPYQADDALRTVVFEPVAIGDGQHYSWPSSTSQILLKILSLFAMLCITFLIYFTGYIF